MYLYILKFFPCRLNYTCYSSFFVLDRIFLFDYFHKIVRYYFKCAEAHTYFTVMHPLFSSTIVWCDETVFSCPPWCLWSTVLLQFAKKFNNSWFKKAKLWTHLKSLFKIKLTHSLSTILERLLINIIIKTLNNYNKSLAKNLHRIAILEHN